MSTAVLSSEYSLCDINLEESSCLKFSETRLTWLKFCEESAIPVPESNPIMITISSALYHFLLDCVVHSSSGTTSSVGNRTTTVCTIASVEEQYLICSPAVQANSIM